MYELSNVTKNYLKGSRTVSAVRDLNLVIGDGEWLAIQGRTRATQTSDCRPAWPGRRSAPTKVGSQHLAAQKCPFGTAE
ncbi:MAG TPA: hypothetical protein VEF71_00095 [Streptosporangiaceae bacterium]|nr:hypothetical protein [Streptosporangiaceae bacterium]